MDKASYWWIPELTDIVIGYVGNEFDDQYLYSGFVISFKIGSSCVANVFWLLSRVFFWVCFAVNVNANELTRLVLSGELESTLHQSAITELMCGAARLARDYDECAGGHFPNRTIDMQKYMQSVPPKLRADRLPTIPKALPVTGIVQQLCCLS